MMDNFTNESKEEWLERLSKSYELGKETIEELAESCLEETTSNLDVLKDVRNDNIVEAERAAHSIKGAAAIMGQGALSTAAHAIESQLKTSCLDGIEEKVKLLESTFNDFKVLIND